MIRLGLDAGRLETIHNDLSLSASAFVIDPCEERIHGSKKVGKEIFVLAVSGQMGMGGHEAVGVDANPVTVFIFQEEVVIKAFSRIGL